MFNCVGIRYTLLQFDFRYVRHSRILGLLMVELDGCTAGVVRQFCQTVTTMFTTFIIVPLVFACLQDAACRESVSAAIKLQGYFSTVGRRI